MTEAPPSSSPPGNLPAALTDSLPTIITRAGSNTVFAAQEFFFGKIRNERTRRAYQHAVRLFLEWIAKHGAGELGQIAPWHVGKYFEELVRNHRYRYPQLASLGPAALLRRDGHATCHCTQPCPLRAG